ncbi:MAG TPA: hypothetical protein VKK79_05740, partial [Candidatus Lokiarchaeia archaeon]|nr:hypothetical protein [Candidatus Lokiarchaeia archaeon]
AGEYTVDGTFNFTSCVQDTQSGIGVVALHLSYDNFATVANYTLEKTSGNDYSVLVSHLPPGTASYYFVAKDCAGNVVTIRPDGGGYFTFTVISLPVHFVIVSLGLSAGAVGVIAFSIAIGRRWRAWKKELMLENRVIDFGNDLGIEPRENYDFA